MKQAVIIGILYDGDVCELFIRDVRGFKYRVSIYAGKGVKDLHMCAGIPEMTVEQYTSLPVIEEVVQALNKTIL